jgi:hypothetical protein
MRESDPRHVLLVKAIEEADLAILAVAFAFGLGASALDGSRRINILAPPVLGLVVWNLLIYLGFAAGAAPPCRGVRRRPLRPRGRPRGRTPPRPAAGQDRLGRLLARRRRPTVRRGLGRGGRAVARAATAALAAPGGGGAGGAAEDGDRASAAGRAGRHLP